MPDAFDEEEARIKAALADGRITPEEAYRIRAMRRQAQENEALLAYYRTFDNDQLLDEIKASSAASVRGLAAMTVLRERTSKP